MTQAQEMAEQLRPGIADRQQPLVFEGEADCDEGQIRAGNNSHSEAVKKAGVGV